MLKQIEKLGLKEKEAKVYLALLELGPSPASIIAQKAKINRTTAYDILEVLVNYGIVSRVGEKTTKHFVAENPELLTSYLKKQSRSFLEKANEVSKLMPELQGLYNKSPSKPRVRFFEGKDGVIQIYEESLTSATEILSWSNIDNLEAFSSEYLNDYYQRRANKKIFIKAIVNNTNLAHQYKKKDSELFREMRIVPKKLMDVTPETYIYDNKVAFMSLAEEFGVIIESKEIAETQKKIFDLAWETAQKYDKQFK